jgi:hypothetical protein
MAIGGKRNGAQGRNRTTDTAISVEDLDVTE